MSLIATHNFEIFGLPFQFKLVLQVQGSCASVSVRILSLMAERWWSCGGLADNRKTGKECSLRRVGTHIKGP